MKDFVITTDSNSDLLESYMKEKKIGIIPHYYDLEGTTYGDEINLAPTSFYDKMRSGLMPTTMASNPEVIHKIFQAYINQNLDVLHISFSSALSGGCSNVVTGAQEICEENPGARIVVIDTLNASLGEGLFILKAVQMKEEGKTLDEIITWLEAHKQEFRVFFTVDDLNHLHRGGRISKTTAIIGSMISIKPILTINSEGQLVSHSSARGRKKSLHMIFNNMLNSLGKYAETLDPICIVHGDCLSDAEFVKSLINQELPDKPVIINYISPSIGAHSGPGALGICYLGERE